MAACVPRLSSDNNFPSSVLKILISVPLSDAVAILVPWIFICMHEILKKKDVKKFSSISRNFYVFS